MIPCPPGFVNENSPVFLKKTLANSSGVWYLILADSEMPSKSNIRVWRSLVSRLNGVQEAAGSNPVTRTKKKSVTRRVADFFLFSTETAPPAVSNAFLTPGSYRASAPVSLSAKDCLRAGRILAFLKAAQPPYTAADACAPPGGASPGRRAPAFGAQGGVQQGGSSFYAAPVPFRLIRRAPRDIPPSCLAGDRPRLLPQAAGSPKQTPRRKSRAALVSTTCCSGGSSRRAICRYGRRHR